MEKLTKKLNIISLAAMFFVVLAILFTTPTIKVNAYDGGYYDSGYYGSGYDSSYYGSGYGYDSGYGSGYGYDSGYGSYYDSGYGSYYDSGYGSYYDSGYGSSYYGGYDNTCYNCGSSYYDTTCYDCYTPPVCTTCAPPVCTTCEPIPPVVPNISLSCSADRSNIDVDESVTWRAYASGGSGSFSYSWSGTDGLSGSGSQISKTYNSIGSKNAHVTVTSGGKTASVDCGTVYVEEQNQTLSGSCSVDDSNINVDESVRWRADASGGNGSYSYEWSGSSPLSGRTGRDVNVYYSSVGTKYGNVTIHSGNQSITRSCGTVYVNDDYNPPYNYDLNVSCNVNNANLSIGQNAIWNAYASGGNGNYYYSWTGTDGLYGNGSSISKVFNMIGTKYATVTVTSNGRTKSLTCPTVVVGGLGYPNLGTPASLTSVYLNQVPYTGVGDNPKFVAFIIGLFMFSALGAYMIVSKRAKIERKNKILDFKNQNMLRKGIK
ncbi:MAG: PKD domain-containing protein [bacterium]